MEFWILHRQKGQTLIQVSLAMLILLGFLALAIDGGHVYAERRRMQNAADAGALAGARSLCAQDGTNPYDEAERYAMQNGAAARPMTSITIEENLVTVVARETINTFLAGVLGGGFATADIGARAAARCGIAGAFCNILPIAYQELAWRALQEGQCEVDEFLVWDDENKELQITDELCNEYGEDCLEVCQVFHCGPAFDPDVEVLWFRGGTRGWLDLEPPPPPYRDLCPQHGSAELQCIIRYGYSGLVQLGDCLCSKQGVDEAARQAVGDYLLDKSVQIPIYDLPCNPASCGGPGGYHIVEIGCIKILAVETIDLEPIEPSEHPRINNVKVIRATVSCTPCYSPCSLLDPNDPTLPGPGDLRAVALVE